MVNMHIIQLNSLVCFMPGYHFKSMEILYQMIFLNWQNFPEMFLDHVYTLLILLLNGQ